MKIYTKRGDKGTTSLVGGVRVLKTDIRLEAYGTVDELNSQLGVLETYLTDPEDIELMEYIQRKLFAIGGYLATDQSKTEVRQSFIVTSDDVKKIEDAIDAAEALLPPLRSFVLPGGARGAAVAHVCRTVCRRTERRILALGEQYPLDEQLLAFMNRLSDYLFNLARKINIITNENEKILDNGRK
ncbi:MAG: cob(I)yrinic acid a,c-diamide adenosyltransferase [Phocaeicola sp.]|uniref:cob(I)yrinic acid a,c-diamide adenosyltransferase n=1 Tax=Phocaeicola TaxID=909656 RepID=UPI00234ED2FA|nr:cob(I)yrinic acid a,c-diamide adenosyltransferase [Phocaeicola oris]MCE2616941.1 cob(I)yrinic acid a,c-diamide adenosyltransferase [Phocaeicola oris]